jgi:hypothetical protein
MKVRKLYKAQRIESSAIDEKRAEDSAVELQSQFFPDSGDSFSRSRSPYPKESLTHDRRPLKGETQSS